MGWDAIGMLEDWKVGQLKGWKVQVMKGFVLSRSHNPRPSRVPQARGEACVTVFERRSYQALPAEGRPGPSEDDDDVRKMMMMQMIATIVLKDKRRATTGGDG